MNRLLAFAIFFSWTLPAFSMPQFLQAFRADPFRNPAIDGCGTCHVNPEGGGPRNPFGQAFMANGERITTLFRAQYPDHFIFPVSKVNDALTIYFSDPEKKQIVTEAAGTKSVVDVAATTVNGQPAGTAAAPGAPPPSAAAFTAATTPVSPVDPYSKEGAYFGSNIVNLPNGKPLKQWEVDFLIGHRFLQDINSAGPGALWGFDSGAYITFGGRVGLTDRISVGVLRSTFFRTFEDRTPIEFNGAFQVSRQKDTVPITIQLRAGLEGSENFTNLYRPFVQAVATRTFADRVSFTAVPTFAWNTRGDAITDQNLGIRTFGISHRNTVALGVGVGIRVLPTVSVVGEYIPRLAGFEGEVQNHPGLSAGLQKSTNRHTFELTVGRQVVMTTPAYSYQGVRSFRVGFNIFRRIR